MAERVGGAELGIGRLFESIRDAVVVAELKSGTIVLWNPAAVEIFGHTPEEAVGQQLHILVPPELKEAHQAGIARYAETQKGDLVDSHKPVELPAITRDGDRITVELQFAPIDASPDGGVYMAGFIRDITERKALEAERTRLATDLELLLHSTVEGLFGLDLDGKVTFINASAAEMLGYREQELVGRNMHELIHHSHEDGSPYPIETCPIFETLRTGRSHRIYDEVVWRKDGALIPTRYSSSPIIDDGRLTGAVVAIEDITHRKRLESALRDNNEQLQLAFDKERDSVKRLRDLDALKNEFVAMVAHDLRSPMTVIAGMADTMRDKWDRLEESKKLTFLDMISQNISRLSELVEDVLVVARIESDEFRYKLEEFDLAELAERVAVQMRGDESSDEAREIEVVAPEDLPPAFADEQRNWQVLTNLVSNALKFSQGPVRLEIAQESPGTLRVSVVDRGIGLDPDELSKLFQKFSRLTQRGIERKVAGTGLGLYICKRMVEDQGGRIGVTSTLGEGSTFWYTLPAATEEAT